GFDSLHAIAASQNWGIRSLFSHLFESCLDEYEDENETTLEDYPEPRVAVIGRPNVGKSTLVNRMLGEERVIVCDMPGTTRDTIYIKMSRFNQEYTLIDTAGVRKKKNVTELVEKFSVIKTLQAIKEANVVL